ncbi:MAG: hypothetical protein KAX81_01100 [Leadbetterella sp.]|nr:hypothetical protein [Leadbetterella sp.]
MENKIFETRQDCVDHFKVNYNNPSHPIAFSGINNVYRFYGGLLGIRDIKNLLSSNESYTLRREFKKKIEILHTHTTRDTNFKLTLLTYHNFRNGMMVLSIYLLV